MDKLVLMDYNGTIVLNDRDIRSYATIIKSIFGAEFIEEFKSPLRSRKMLVDKNFSHEKFIEFFKNFKSSEIYDTFKNSNNDRILSILKKCDELPNENIEDFIFEEIIYPLMALYNVHIVGIKPFLDFPDFFKNIQKDHCVVINSDSPHSVLLIELEEYAKMEEYSFIKELLDRGLVYGNTGKDKKEDNSRIERIIGDLRKRGFITEKLESIDIVGDEENDYESFKSAISMDTHNKTRLNLSMQNNLFLVKKLREQVSNLIENMKKISQISKNIAKKNLKELSEVLKRDKERLENAKKKLKEIEEKIKKFNEISRESKGTIKINKSLRDIVLSC